MKENALKVVCSRCGHEDLWTSKTPQYLKWEWAEVQMGRQYEEGIAFDLCPACTREVKAWIRNGR